MIGISPSLSTENILEVLDKELDIPRHMVLSILLNNVSSLKNGDVLLKLDELVDPLTIWERDSIYSAMQTIDIKEMLQIELNQSISDYQLKLFQDYSSVRNDSTIMNKDSLLNILKLESRDFSPLRTDLFEAMNKLDWIQMQNTIFEWQSQIKEDTHEYKDLMLLSVLLENVLSIDLLSDSAYLSYNGFAQNYLYTQYPLTYRAAVMIEGLLATIPFHGDLDYELVDTQLRSTKLTNFSTTPKLDLTISPNPASEFARITSKEYNLINCSVNCFDASGKNCPVEIITASDHEIILSVIHLNPGVYFVEIGNNHEHFTCSLHILR